MEGFPGSTPEETARRLEDWREERCEWRQGDCVLQPCDFLWLAKAEVNEGEEVAAQTFPGAVVLTQTCDIVRSCDDRRFLEVAPLVEVEVPRLSEIRKGRQPGYLYVPALAEKRLVGDLSRPMTVEKSVVAGWERVPGWSSDPEGRDLSRAIVRRLERFAFPDDIVGMYDKWQRRVKAKHGKPSPEGQALDRILEIRVEAAPTWDAATVEITFLCILPEDSDELERDVLSQIPTWEELLEKPSRVVRVGFEVERLSTLTAQRYLASSRMDFDHLSARKP